MRKAKKNLLLCFAGALALAGAFALAACAHDQSAEGPDEPTPAGAALTFVVRTAGAEIGGEYYPFYDFTAEVSEVTLIGRGTSKKIALQNGSASVEMSGLSKGEYEAAYSYTANGVSYSRSVQFSVDPAVSQSVLLPVSPVSLNGRTSTGELSTTSMAVTVSGQSDSVRMTRGGGYSYLDGSGTDSRYYVEGVLDATQNFGSSDVGGLLVACDAGKPTSGILAGISSDVVCFALPANAGTGADDVYRVCSLAEFEDTAGYDRSHVRLGVLRDGACYFVYVNGELAARWYCDSVAWDDGTAQPSAAGVAATTGASGTQVLSFNYTADEAALTALAGLAEEETIDLYFIAGQSNAVGYSPMTEEVRKADARNVSGYSNIFYAGDAISSSANVHHALDWRMVTQGLGRDASTFGPELGMANALSSYYNAETGRKAAIVKYAVGGTSLLNSLTGENATLGNWVSPSYEAALGSSVTNPTLTGGLYDGFIAETQMRIAQLEAMGYSVRIRGLYWMQGENDRGNPNEYKQAFGYLVNDLRDDLGASLDIYVGEISKSFGGVETAVNNAFIAAQDAIVEATENCFIIASGDFKIGIGYGSPDTSHWSGADQYAIGKLLGESILANTLS